MGEVLFGTWSLAVSIPAFVVGALVIGWAGTKLAEQADILADRTGLGEAISGALFLGASTSLPGVVTSVVAAAAGHPSLAVANAIGGIAAQLAFLAIADITYRHANLEHAAASPSNMLQAALLIVLLAILLMGPFSPDMTLWGIHPATPMLLIAYGYGLRIVFQGHEEPMWVPWRTSVTQVEAEQPTPEDARTLAQLWLALTVTALAVGTAGWAVAQSGISIATHTGLSETVVGGLLTAVVTSLPELVTTIAAVGRGALALAVGNVIGGNGFDTLFVAIADVFYREGSIYHAVGQAELMLTVLTILLTAVLMMGLVRRERSGIANIGFESMLMLVLYVAGFLLVALS